MIISIFIRTLTLLGTDPKVSLLAGLNAPAFISYTTMNDTQTLASTWNVTLSEARDLSTYLLNVMNTYVHSFFQNQLFPMGTGPLVSRTPIEIIWTGRDPLFQLFGFPTDNVGMNWKADYYESKEGADNNPKKNQTIWLGGNRSDFKVSF